jgi:hypothetical protein
MQRGWDSSLGIEPGYGLDGQGSIPGRGKIFSHTPSYSIGTGGSFSGVKRLGRDADHSHLNAKGRMVELYLHSTPRVVLN